MCSPCRSRKHFSCFQPTCAYRPWSRERWRVLRVPAGEEERRSARLLAPRAIATGGEEFVVPRLHPWAHGRSSGADGIAVRGASRGGLSVTADDKGKRAYPLPSTSNFIPHEGAGGKPPVVPHNRRSQARSYGNGRSEIRVLLSTSGSRGDAEPMMGLALQLRALGAEGCEALVATGVAPAGVWR
jgi:hypothetical protein